MFIILYLTYFTYMTISRSLHVAADGIISVFLWLGNTPLFIPHLYPFMDI